MYVWDIINEVKKLEKEMWESVNDHTKPFVETNKKINAFISLISKEIKLLQVIEI